MNFLDMIIKQEADREMLVADGRVFTYKDIIDRARTMANSQDKHVVSGVRVIKKPDILSQLTAFLAAYINKEIPLIVPYDNNYFEADSYLPYMEIPERASFAVATSGTTGQPKIYFRSYESWADYFPVQNRIFHIDNTTRLFCQGSLAFTGNLNLYLGVFSVGGTVVASNKLVPDKWREFIEEFHANAIYLIPSKLLLLGRVYGKTNDNIKMIISGSQSLGQSDAESLKKVFPKTEIILYYGASELNYISYVSDKAMSSERNLIGRAFPDVKVWIQEGKICVDTRYHVEGISCPYTLPDAGYMDKEGNLYFDGRTDDILNIHGRKISALKVENTLEACREIAEAAVIYHRQLIAYITLSTDENVALDESEVLSSVRRQLKQSGLSSYEMPQKIHIIDKLPRNDSGKTDKRALKEI
jgi:long-chain acyl-CoA synthetase